MVAFGADARLDVGRIYTGDSPLCIAGQILQGLKKPHDCPAFGALCTPESPLGATMVSAEGACAAYYRYGRHLSNYELGITNYELESAIRGAVLDS